MDTEILHGILIGLTILISTGTGLLLAQTTGRWLNDDAQLSILSRSRLARGPWLVVAGILIAAAAILLFPSSHIIPVDPGWSAEAPLSGTVFDPAAPNPADSILSATIIGVVAAATPHLFVVDIAVHRLPDRIVWPLIALCLVALLTGSLLGQSRIWFFGLFAGLAAAVLFALIHLIGRLTHKRTMGLGDVKLAFIVFSVAGLFDAWAPALAFIFMMAIAGIWALLAAAVKGRVRGITIAFGPAMLSGMWLGSVLAPFIL